MLRYVLMAQLPIAVYANTVNFRLTPIELVLDFGSFFADKPGQVPPSDFKHDVRVVLPAGSLPGIVQALSQAMARQPKETPKQAPGFKLQPAPPESKV